MRRHARTLLYLCLPPAIAVMAACRTGAPADQAARGDTVAANDAQRAPAQGQRVLPGLEVLVRDSAHLVRDRRVGLITNHTAVTTGGQHAVDYLRAHGVNLVALFGPEHGVRGDVEAGLKIEDNRDPETGIPVYSLYGQTQRPTAQMLQGVDVLMFDIQDIGARPYTYVWTMAMAMEEAAKRNIPFIVLDRPNPITARVDGPLMQMDVREVTQVITGYYKVPLRHGMTVGEVAMYYNTDAGVGADLRVIPVDGWNGGVWFDDAGLPWLNPSPNIRSLDGALKYAGWCWRKRPTCPWAAARTRRSRTWAPRGWMRGAWWRPPAATSSPGCGWTRCASRPIARTPTRGCRSAAKTCASCA
jgi:uncharacterized protein YbbC (DUF1343 family)